MSFYSYKNANAAMSPGCITGNPCEGLTERVCIQVKNVYDSCLQQEQLDDKTITVSGIVPVLPDVNCQNPPTRPCKCECSGCSCECTCRDCGGTLTYNEAVENAENSPCRPQPCGTWTFESCRSSTTCGTISNLTIDRLCDRPQFARVKGTISIPIDVLFVEEGERLGTVRRRNDLIARTRKHRAHQPVGIRIVLCDENGQHDTAPPLRQGITHRQTYMFCSQYNRYLFIKHCYNSIAI